MGRSTKRILSEIGMLSAVVRRSDREAPVNRSDGHPLTAGGTPLLKQRNHIVEIGITSTEAPREPVSTPLRNLLAVRQHVKLTSGAGCEHGCDAEPLLNEGRETRDLGFIVLSGRTGEYFDLHSIPRNRVSGPAVELS